MQTQLQDSYELEFATRASKFNGLGMAVTRKADSVLLRFKVTPSDEKGNRQALDLLEKLAHNPNFTVTPAIDVPDTIYHAADITSAERDTSLFVLPAPGKSADDAYTSLLAALARLQATPPNTNFSLRI